jgi:hypothetical protein
MNYVFGKQREYPSQSVEMRNGKKEKRKEKKEKEKFIKGPLIHTRLLQKVKNQIVPLGIEQWDPEHSPL